jgi:acetyl esterase/lipase
MQAPLASIPIGGATDDPLATTADAFASTAAAAGGQVELVSTGKVGHSSSSVDAGDVASFFCAHGGYLRRRNPRGLKVSRNRSRWSSTSKSAASSRNAVMAE